MAITGNLLKIITRYTWLQQKCENVMWYEAQGAAFLTATAAGVGEAYWNDVKDLYRAIAPALLPDCSFESVLVYEYNGGDAYGEYAVPTLERVGLRDTTNKPRVTGTLAGGVRLTVATRATRPGQKRVPFLLEEDIDNNDLGAAYLALLENLAAIWDTPRVLGAPVALGVLAPVIVSLTGTPPMPTAYQEVIGHLVNRDITSQVSRKKGRGA